MSQEYCDNKLMYQKSHKALIERTFDVQFIFESDNDTIKIPANKAALTASSSVFNAMFNGELKETGDIKIIDASPEAFHEFLQFFYEYKVKLTMKNIAEVLKIVDKYDVADCLPVCSDFLKKNVKIDDILWVLHLAVQYNLDDLKTYSEQMIGENHKTIFDMIDFNGGRLRVASDNRLLDHELENILPFLFVILKNINSKMTKKLESPTLTVTLVSTNITTASYVTSNEATIFVLNKTMLLTEIICSNIAMFKHTQILDGHSFKMSIAELPSSKSRFTETIFKQSVIIGGDVDRTHIKFEQPIRIEQGIRYKIIFKSDQIPKGLCTQKEIISHDTHIELTPSCTICFVSKDNPSAHSLISQLCFELA